MKKPNKEVTFKFFNYKWTRAPDWASATEDMYRQWYWTRYGYKSAKGLKAFLRDKNLILDAGCGLGRDTKMFVEFNPKAKVVAIDQSPQALRVAIKHLTPVFNCEHCPNRSNCEIRRGDITKFIYPEKFDFISCDQVLHHTPDPTATLEHLYSQLKIGGVINFFVCRKKNAYRDFVDDAIMAKVVSMSPQELWDFAVTVTTLGKALYELNIPNVKFGEKSYPNLQRFVHDQVFRCWYNPDTGFDLSVSSNYDWFSGNPRFNLEEVKMMIKKGAGPHRLLRIYEDDASISVSMRRTR